MTNIKRVTFFWDTVYFVCVLLLISLYCVVDNSRINLNKLIKITILRCWMQVNVQQFYKRRPLVSFSAHTSPSITTTTTITTAAAAAAAVANGDVDTGCYSNAAASLSDSQPHPQTSYNHEYVYNMLGTLKCETWKYRAWKCGTN